MGKYVNLTKTEIDEMAEMYKNNIPITSIAKRFNTSGQTVRRRLEKRNDIIFRGNRKHFYNETIFETIDSPEKAYWLGFILADGYVNEDRGFMRLKLSDIDENHLIKFINFINGDMNMLHEEYHNITGNRQVYVEANGKKFVSTLVSNNIIQAKSRREQWSNNVHEEYIRDYIRGIIDADGHISIGELNICGSYEVLHNIEIHLESTLNKNLNLNIYDHSNTKRVRFHRKDIKDVLDYIYYDGCLSLDRKKYYVNINRQC